MGCISKDDANHLRALIQAERCFHVGLPSGRPSIVLILWWKPWLPVIIGRRLRPSLRLPLRLERSVGLVEDDLRYGPAFVADKLHAVAFELADREDALAIGSEAISWLAGRREGEFAVGVDRDHMHNRAGRGRRRRAGLAEQLRTRALVQRQASRRNTISATLGSSAASRRSIRPSRS